MNALPSLVVFGAGVAGYQAAAANKGLLEVDIEGHGGYVAYTVEVIKDTVRNSAIGVAALVIAHYVVEAAPVVWAMLPAAPAPVASFFATVWVEGSAFILGMSLPQVAIALAVAAAVSLLIVGSYLIYKKIKEKEVVVLEEVVIDPNANAQINQIEILEKEEVRENVKQQKQEIISSRASSPSKKAEIVEQKKQTTISRATSPNKLTESVKKETTTSTVVSNKNTPVKSTALNSPKKITIEKKVVEQKIEKNIENSSTDSEDKGI
ncbi:MAG: hypothetical protein H0T62_14125 [Parachlamydiaceae bacterium]|nr:hypothetical protein [Parachlamydiaceae bacterium]